MAHIPLISEKLPANAYYFFLNFLSLVRLNFDGISESFDQVETKLREYEMISDENSAFSA